MAHGRPISQRKEAGGRLVHVDGPWRQPDDVSFLFRPSLLLLHRRRVLSPSWFQAVLAWWKESEEHGWLSDGELPCSQSHSLTASEPTVHSMTSSPSARLVLSSSLYLHLSLSS